MKIEDLEEIEAEWEFDARSVYCATTVRNHFKALLEVVKAAQARNDHQLAWAECDNCRCGRDCPTENKTVIALSKALKHLEEIK